MGIDTLGLVKTEQELQAEQQAAQQAQQAAQEQAQQEALLRSKMADPQNLANAAATAQQMQMAEEQPTEQ